MITLHNDKLVMQIAELGAEPQSLRSKETGCEYIWNGDPEYWFRHAPLLFPMTGPTKDDKVSYQGVTYPMPGNGFARDTEFSVVEADDSHAVFLLEESPATFEHYPFPFCLTVTYTLLSDGYEAKATIRAKESDLWFTFGWHPAFSLDMNGVGTPIEAYRIEFSESETSDRKYQVDGVFRIEPNFLDGAKSFQLSRNETDKGPIVLPTIKSRQVKLVCDAGPHGVAVDMGEMPLLVVWTCAPKHGQYVCVEPMYSFGDTTRPLDLDKMPQTMHIGPKEDKTFTNTFRVF
ncbi:MAG: hypothetical protein ACOX6K_07105 [Sphaerochaetaceae bacterium]|jgi:galactose mutarotase-like enzyme